VELAVLGAGIDVSGQLAEQIEIEPPPGKVCGQLLRVDAGHVRL